jgi:PEGA domain
MATLLAVCAVSVALLVGGAAPASGADASAPGDAGAVVETGTLDLKSNPPGAEIVIDGGKSYGRTPGTITLPAGQHQLTLKSPSPKDFKDRTLTITINGGKPTRLTLDLAHATH